MFRLHLRKSTVVLLGLTGLLTGSLLLNLSSSATVKTARYERASSLDDIFGTGGRRQHAARLARRRYDGKTFSWRQYARWGKELLVHGQVKQPSVGPSPSVLLSKTYRCVHCHNLEREDAVLTRQNPETREAMLRAAAPADPRCRDGRTLGMVPGTTLWGAVNRESFYNGYYSKYHRLTLQGGRRVNPRSLADAIQMCSRYCSCGRFAETWELDSMLAYLWDKEVRFADVGLAVDVERRLLADLNSGQRERIRRARRLLRQSYLHAAGANTDARPRRCQGATDYYDDGGHVAGCVRSGKLLYLSACACCHGNKVHADENADLITSYRRFHRHVRHGTLGDRNYMPLFTRERLSRRQLADIRVYLESLIDD